jgi:hypothetical protein
MAINVRRVLFCLGEWEKNNIAAHIRYQRQKVISQSKLRNLKFLNLLISYYLNKKKVLKIQIKERRGIPLDFLNFNATQKSVFKLNITYIQLPMLAI